MAKIIICRHAESMEDVDKSIYDTMNDLDAPLTPRGMSQAENLSAELVRLLEPCVRVQLYASPGYRNVQTLNIVLPRLQSEFEVNFEVEPLIVKQHWGSITSENRPSIEAERYRVGVLRYKFPTGESAESLIARLTKFARKVFSLQAASEETDVVVFSHGFEFRVLLMIILGWDEEVFESFANLDNCEHRILTRVGQDRYALDRPLRKHGRPITRIRPT